MSVLSRPYFHDEEKAFAYLESVLWADGAVCPHCGGVDRITKVKANPSKRIRLGLWRCGDCKGQFTVKVGTVFEHVRIPLNKALQAVYLMTSSKKGISAHQLHRVLEVTYKTAWFLAHRIREAIREDWRTDYKDFGTIEGRLTAIQEQGTLQLLLKDEWLSQTVRCYVPEDMLPEAFAAFRRRVEISGMIHYRRNGTPISVEVDGIEPLPNDEDLPSAEDVRGLLKAG